ncbi:MAG: single-stranded-DNA-specific exonuclease RecJ, partial [Chloroflexota bacterium]
AMQKRWHVPPVITPEADRNLDAFHPVLRQLLFNRGYATEGQARAFLGGEPGFSTDPFELSGMAAVVDRVRFAVEHRQPVAVYGDYDVDGVTATALLVEALRDLDTDVRPYIPNRFDEGYGLNTEALDNLKAEGVRLVITMDCGIRSPQEARHARDIGLDLIISDHHHPADGDLPQAVAIVNSKLPGDEYPDKNLAGVGIAFKIAEALESAGSSRGNLVSLLDLVALGTVADLAPLIGENRGLVRRGLDQIRNTQRQGLFSLANVAAMQISKTTANQIGFMLGPRLNAAGRLKSAKAALELLMTNDPSRAGLLAQELDANNQERQTVTRETQIKAEALATAGEEDPDLLFAAHEDFNPGVVGLAASRLVEAHYRPAVVAAKGPDETRGSCRSIPEFHITDALDKCADLLVRHGGHAAAAGFTVRNENLPRLIERLKALAAAELGQQDLHPTLYGDMELTLSTLNFELLRHLGGLEPTGYGNREAVFVSRGVKVKSSRVVGADGRHLKLTLQDERGVTTDAIGFRLGHLQPELPSRVDLAYTLESNDYNGRTTLQLNLKDIRAPRDHGWGAASA